MTVEAAFRNAGETLACVIGGHEFVTYETIPNQALVREVDGHVICDDHVLAIQEGVRGRPLSESTIKRILIRRDEARIKDRAEARLRRGSDAPGWVYYVRVENLIKIGFTNDLSRRIRSYPPNAVLLAAHPGTKATESQMHKQFAEARARGREWFTATPRIMGHIEDVNQLFGKPEGIVKPMRHANRKERVSPFNTGVLR